MIIPSINLNVLSAGPNFFDQLNAAVERWSILGRVAIRNGRRDMVDLLAAVATSAGGKVDLQIELIDPTIDDALQLLNVGAMEIMVDAGHIRALLTAVPAERLIGIVSGQFDSDALARSGTKLLFQNNDAPDALRDSLSENWIQSESAEPSIERIERLDKSWTDCLVDVTFLESQPDFVANSLAVRLSSDRTDGLWPTIISDQLGMALGLAYSNLESLQLAIKKRIGVFWSRSRNEIWEKGKTSGATQRLTRVDLDCDRDCLRFTVVQKLPGFCHRNNYNCFGGERSIQTVLSRLTERISGDDTNSFSKKLANDPEMLRKKLLEEAGELADANEPVEVAWEAADLLYFSLVRMIDSGVGLEDVYRELARRLNRVVRRPNKLEKNEGQDD